MKTCQYISDAEPDGCNQDATTAMRIADGMEAMAPWGQKVFCSPHAAYLCSDNVRKDPMGRTWEVIDRFPNWYGKS